MIVRWKVVTCPSAWCIVQRSWESVSGIKVNISTASVSVPWKPFLFSCLLVTRNPTPEPRSEYNIKVINMKYTFDWQYFGIGSSRILYHLDLKGWRILSLSFYHTRPIRTSLLQYNRLKCQVPGEYTGGQSPYFIPYKYDICFIWLVVAWYSLLWLAVAD